MIDESILAAVAATEPLRREYLASPDFVERWFKIDPLSALIARPGVIGATRLVVIPSLKPERVITLLLRDHEVEVEAAGGTRSLWHSLAGMSVTRAEGKLRLLPCQPLSLEEVTRATGRMRLPSTRCPRAFASWAALRTLAAGAGSCSVRLMDGVSYVHRLLGQGERFDGKWVNPGLPEHPRQVELIESYEQILDVLASPRARQGAG